MKIKEDKELGDIFAGEERHAPNFNDPELNTPIEKDLIDDLENHIESSMHKLSINSADLIQKFITSGQYDDIVVEPDEPMVFRGLRFKSTKDYIEFIEKLNLTVRTIPDKFKLPEKLKFSPLNGRTVTSWTKSAKVARGFAEDEQTGEHGIILCSLVIDNPNKFFDLQYWYEKISDYNAREKEVVGMGDILVDSIYFIKY